MIRFLLKGVLRDRQRSLFPVITVTIGVMLTVLLNSWVKGIMGDIADNSARFSTGHVKIVTAAYAEQMEQAPIDLAIFDVQRLLSEITSRYPEITWVERIRFGGLLDIPDDTGETKSQGPAGGLAVDLLSPERGAEIARMNIRGGIVRGRMPARSGEVLLGDVFAKKLGVVPGNRVTLISATMHGSLSIRNFTVAGTVVFGVMAMDRGMILMDITDAREAFDMSDAVGELLGFFKDDRYTMDRAENVKRSFNTDFSDRTDPFSPTMRQLKDQNDLETILLFSDRIGTILVSVFVLFMSIVLWNAGLLGGLRRYGEMGLRLAMGEEKGHVYRTLVGESILVGLAGSFTGTAMGLVIALIIENVGIDISRFMSDTGLMLPTVFRTHVSGESFYIGFLPGLISTVLGSLLAGIGIYGRNTADLFKELEA